MKKFNIRNIQNKRPMKKYDLNEILKKTKFIESTSEELHFLEKRIGIGYKQLSCKKLRNDYLQKELKKTKIIQKKKNKSFKNEHSDESIVCIKKIHFF